MAPPRTWTLAASLVFALAAPACRRRHDGRAAPPLQRVAWRATPPEGPAFRVDRARWVRGGARVQGERVASAPWPATPLVAAAALAGDVWLFAAEDGTVFRAATFLGPLAAVGALEGRALPLGVGAVASARPVSRGALFLADERRCGWVADGASLRPVAVTQVLGGACLSARDLLAVVDGGGLVASRDGGATFAPVVLPAGSAVAVEVVGDAAVVHATEGAYRWRDGQLTPAPGVRPLRDENAPDGPAEAALAALRGGDGPLPAAREQAVENPDGTVTVVRGDRVVTLDPRTGAARRSVEAPGEACALARASDGLRAVCRRAWATAVYALRDGQGAWATLRDEQRQEPMGRAVFDERSRAWAVAAPCVQRAVDDPRRVCVYDDAGVPREYGMPFAAWPAAMRDGAALVLDAEAAGGESTDAIVLRGGAIVRAVLPVSGEGAHTVAFDGDDLVAWMIAEGGAVLGVARGARRGDGFVWSRAEAPAGAARGAFLRRGGALVTGRDASLVAVSERGGAFRALPSPVAGGARRAALGGALFCAGPWCRVADGLSLAMGERGDAPLVAAQ